MAAESRTSFPTSHIKKLHAEYLALSAEVDAIKQKQSDLKDRLIAQLEKHETSEVKIGGKIALAHKPVASARFDGTAFKKAYPELHAEFLKPSTSMRFTCK